MRMFRLIPYMIAISLAFYVLPILVDNTPFASFTIVIGLPIIVFILAMFHGMRRGFNYLIPIMTPLIFLPSIFIFYNPSAWIYIIVYAVIGLFGNIIGRLFYKFG